MTATVPTTEPTEAIAGDTWEWTHVSSTCPRTDGWVLAYRIAGPGVLRWKTDYIAADGAGWHITVDAAASDVDAGEYTIWREFTLDAKRTTERVGFCIVRANPAELDPGENVYWAIPALEAVRAAIAGRATTAQMQSMIGGRQVMWYQPEQLMKLESWLAGKVNRRRRGGRRFQYLATFGAGR